MDNRKLQHIGKKIKQFRREKGLRQKELADILNVSQSTVSYAENADRDGTTTDVMDAILAEYPEIDKNYFLRDITDIKDNITEPIVSYEMQTKESELMYLMKKHVSIIEKLQDKIFQLQEELLNISKENVRLEIENEQNKAQQ